MTVNRGRGAACCLDRYLEIDPANLCVVTQPGVINATLKAAVAAEGLFYPPDPASYETCSIGGNLGTNAGGLCCVKYGVTAGGPVYLPKLYNGRDRTFFLFSWESYRQITGAVRRSRVPTALERTGNFSQSVDTSGKPILLNDPLSGSSCTASNKSGCFPGNLIPASRIDPIAQKILSYYPTPNWNGVNNYVTNANNPGNWDSFLTKIDQRFSDKDSISGRYLVRNNDRVNPFQGSDLGTFGSAISERMSLFGITYNRMFTPTLINEARAGVTRTTKNEHSKDSNVNVAVALGIPGTTTDPIEKPMELLPIGPVVFIDTAHGHQLHA